MPKKQAMKKQSIREIIRKLSPCDPIIIFWVDAGDDEPPVNGLVWKSMKDSTKSMKEIQIKTVGFYHCMKAKTLFLFNNVDLDEEDPQIANQAQIPLGCIKSLRKLKDE